MILPLFFFLLQQFNMAQIQHDQSIPSRTSPLQKIWAEPSGGYASQVVMLLHRKRETF